MDYYAQWLIRREITKDVPFRGYKTNLILNPYLSSKTDPISPQIPKFYYTNIAFSLKTNCCRRHTCTCATKFLHHLSTGCCLPKQCLGPKLEGGWARAASKKFGTPYVFLQPLKLAVSNMVHKLGLGLAYQKTRFRAKIGGGLG